MEYSHSELSKHFWDGKDEKGENGKQYKLDREGIEHALLRALGDFTPRTEELKPGKHLELKQMLKKLVDDYDYVEKFFSFFNNNVLYKNEESFNNWHNDRCIEFLNCFNGYFKNGLAYGKAQKIVNMTFKGIYCLQGAEDYEDFFEFCHMPLDSLTLEWFYRAGKSDSKRMNINGKNIYRNRIFPWSKLQNKDTYDENGHLMYNYSDIQKAIRKYFENTGWTPLTAEFLIWPQIQLELAAESLFSQLTNLDSENTAPFKEAEKDFKSRTTKEKLEFLQEKIGKMDNFIYGDVNQKRCSYPKTK